MINRGRLLGASGGRCGFRYVEIDDQRVATLKPRSTTATRCTFQGVGRFATTVGWPAWIVARCYVELVRARTDRAYLF